MQIPINIAATDGGALQRRHDAWNNGRRPPDMSGARKPLSNTRTSVSGTRVYEGNKKHLEPLATTLLGIFGKV